MPEYFIRCSKRADGYVAQMVNETGIPCTRSWFAGATEHEAVGRLTIWFLSTPGKCPFQLGGITFD